jgi:molecular chaperone HtpG
MEKGTISIHTENIFPIIKKFLYSDHEIFLRELVSNAVDATQKLKKLASMGEFTGELGDTTIEISFDKDKKTITVSDKGIGMTGEEVKKYINQIAFSGQPNLLKSSRTKPMEKTSLENSALDFILPSWWPIRLRSSPVRIKPRKMKQPVGNAMVPPNLSFPPHLKKNEELMSFCTSQGLRRIPGRMENKRHPEKYCKFLPVQIKFGTKEESEDDGVDAEGKPKFKTKTVDRIINNPNPLWAKSPNDLKDEDYLKFTKSFTPIQKILCSGSTSMLIILSTLRESCISQKLKTISTFRRIKFNSIRARYSSPMR